MKRPNRDLLKGLLHGSLTPSEFVVRSQQGSRVKVSFMEEHDGQYFDGDRQITQQEYNDRIETARRNRTLVDFSEL